VLDHDWFCEQAEQEISTLAAVVADASDVALDVPSCPGWNLTDLARHTGAMHRWTTTIVETEAGGRVAFPEVELPWDSADGLAQWLDSGATPLTTALRLAGPLTAVWSWGPGRTSGWWARRILHETTVHRADAELALGVVDPVIDPVVAADGIDEFLFNLPSARRAYPHLASLPTGASLHLHATDYDDGEWVVRFTDSGVDWQRGHEKATTAIRGPVTSLLLFTYGRRPVSDPRLTSFGDDTIPALWQEKTAL
jgi:uncharacterized protein (TIGR03083 family)